MTPRDASSTPPASGNRRRARNRPKPARAARATEQAPSKQPPAAAESPEATAKAARGPRFTPARAKPNRGLGGKETSDRQWHELAGGGRSQVTRGATIRVRDADRPTAAELAAAEAEVVVQRRNWAPPPD